MSSLPADPVLLGALAGGASGISAIVVGEAAALALAVTRLLGFVLVAPFPGANVPGRVKVGLVLLVAFLARAAIPQLAIRGPLTFDLRLMALVPSELTIGLLIGFTVRVTFASAEILGATFAQSTGLTMGHVFDPALGTEDTVMTRVVTLLAMLLFLAVGAHRVAIGYAIESFRVMPIGQSIDAGAALPSFLSYVDSAMEAGVRLSLPVMAVALSIQVTLALVARASPSLQIFSIGMGVTVAAGLLAILGSLHDVGAGLGSTFQSVGPRIEHVVSDVAHPREP